MSEITNVRKVAYITGTRADYGLMRRILQGISDSENLHLELYIAGMHLLESQGSTVALVKSEFPSASILNSKPNGTKLSDNSFFAAQLIDELTHAFLRNRPDIVLVLGDRVEMLATSLVALYLHLPVVHIQGGDVTGTVDDIARHATTKLSQLHLVATTAARNRVIAMGEEPKRVQVVGSPGVDSIVHLKLPDDKTVYEEISLDLNSKFVLVTLHPESETITDSGHQMELVLSTVSEFKLPIVLIYPNSDPGSAEMIAVIEKWCS